MKTLATISVPSRSPIGINTENDKWYPPKVAIAEFMMDHDIDAHVTSLMAGLDQACAVVTKCWLQRELHVIRPFPDHDNIWPPRVKEINDMLIHYADSVKSISDTPARHTVTLANDQVLENADILLVIPDGKSVTINRVIASAKNRHMPAYALDIDTNTVSLLH